MHPLLYNSAFPYGSEHLNTSTSQVRNSRQDTYEYLLVIPAGKEIKQQLAAERQQFFNLYQSGIDDREEAQITIMRFTATEDMEATVIRWLQRICSQQESFIVTLNNYGGYPPNNIHL